MSGSHTTTNTSSTTPLDATLPDVPGLLPISPVALQCFILHKVEDMFSSRCASRDFPDLVGNFCKLTVQALNFLACAGWTDTPICLICPERPSSAQVRTLELL